LTALLLIALYLGEPRGRLTSDCARMLMQEFTRLLHKMETVLRADDTGIYENLGRQIFRHTDFLYLARGIH
jgi:glucosamine 6-phosphate synthetase-like amidotransferase/phosphosugar isomerase protein